MRHRRNLLQRLANALTKPSSYASHRRFSESKVIPSILTCSDFRDIQHWQNHVSCFQQMTARHHILKMNQVNLLLGATDAPWSEPIVVTEFMSYSTAVQMFRIIRKIKPWGR